jgi:hypothetical protein
VLRNFPGVLMAGPKYKLAEASYLLGLRALKRTLLVAQDQLEECRTYFGQLFRERQPSATTEEVEKSADQALIWLTGAAAYGIIKRICMSIGLPELQLTFDEVFERHSSNASVRLVDLAIRLDSFPTAPEKEILDLDSLFHKNPFAYRLLRVLVAEFLLLRNTDHRMRQRLGELFQIRANDPKFLLHSG